MFVIQIYSPIPMVRKMDSVPLKNCFQQHFNPTQKRTWQFRNFTLRSNKINSMEIKVLAFGIAKDILKSSILNIDLKSAATIADLKSRLIEQYPDFQKLASLSIAVNCDYVDDYQILKPNDEIVIIPPVSGG